MFPAISSARHAADAKNHCGYPPCEKARLNLENKREEVVVKVTPSVGSVKYKAQHVVLPARIPILTGGKVARSRANGGF
jgi:hypothetical protein